MRRALIAFVLLALIAFAYFRLFKGTPPDFLFRFSASLVRRGDILRQGITRLLGVSQELERLERENAALRREFRALPPLGSSQNLIPIEVLYVERLAPWPQRLILLSREKTLSPGDLLVLEDGATLVGVIDRVDGSFAAANTLLSSALEVFVLGLESGARGATHGSDTSGFFITVRVPPDSPDLTEGEVVESAGVGEIPRGLRVGTVAPQEVLRAGAFRIHLLIPPFSLTLSEPLFVMPRASFPEFSLGR